MSVKRKSSNLLANRTASVSLTRNGLTIQIEGVPAVDAGVVSKALLDGVRNLVRLGYDELVEAQGSHHAGPLGEVPDDADQDEVVRHEDKRVGFVQ